MIFLKMYSESYRESIFTKKQVLCMSNKRVKPDVFCIISGAVRILKNDMSTFEYSTFGHYVYLQIDGTLLCPIRYKRIRILTPEGP